MPSLYRQHQFDGWQEAAELLGSAGACSRSIQKSRSTDYVWVASRMPAYWQCTGYVWHFKYRKFIDALGHSLLGYTWICPCQDLWGRIYWPGMVGWVRWVDWILWVWRHIQKTSIARCVIWNVQTLLLLPYKYLMKSLKMFSLPVPVG